MQSIKKQLEPVKIIPMEIHKSAGILDDHSIRKTTNAREGYFNSIELAHLRLIDDTPTIYFWSGDESNYYGKLVAGETTDDYIQLYSHGFLNLDADSDITITSNFGSVYCANDFLPDTTATYDLGSSSYKWEDIHTDGDIYIYKPTTNDYKITTDESGQLAIEGQTSAAQTSLSLYTKDGDGTDGCFFNIFGKGTAAASSTNYEKMPIQYGASSQIFVIKSIAGGTGTVRPLYIYTGANTTQLVLAVDGSISMGGVLQTGGYKSSDGTAGLTATKTFVDASALTNTVTIKNGLITAWSQC